MKINEAVSGFDVAKWNAGEELHDACCLIVDAEESLRLVPGERVKLARAHLRQALRCIRREREVREKSNAANP